MNWHPHTIRQADSPRDFSSRQGMECAGILCVFQAFQTAALAEKIRRSAMTNCAVLPLKMKNPSGIRRRGSFILMPSC